MKKGSNILLMALGVLIIILAIAGAVYLLLGSGRVEQTQNLKLANGSELELTFHHPERLMVGRSGKLWLSVEPVPCENCPVAVEEGDFYIDRELVMPGYVVLPQKRMVSQVKNTKGDITGWTTEALQEGKVDGKVWLAASSSPIDGSFALIPQGEIDFQLQTYKLVGLDYSQAMVALAAVAGLGLILIITGRITKRKTTKRKPEIYG